MNLSNIKKKYKNFSYGCSYFPFNLDAAMQLNRLSRDFRNQLNKQLHSRNWNVRCPQGTILPTLPPRVLQGAAVSDERISQGPPGNVVSLGCPPPPRRVSEQSVQTLPVGSPFQDVILTAQLHINPETSLERLVPIVEFWQRENFCQIYLAGSCRL